jgi:Cd2+/Zn2+-exporting ATPase
MSLAAMLVAGLPIARSAWRAIRINREININVLMTIAAVGAVIIGAYTEAGLVMVLFAIGEALEGYTTEKARDSIRSLMQVAPNEATVLRACIECKEHLGQDGYEGGPCPFCGLEETRVFVDEIRVGDTLIVKPGERIAMDGRVTGGASSVNQAPITGESVPVEKSAGSDVFAGTINEEGALEITVSTLAEDNTISRIIRMVEEAQERKAPAERFVDQFAKYYTPAVVVLAVLVAAVPPLVLGGPFWGEQGWFYRALELLVVACPCALVISTPVAIIAAISNAARNGVLIKGGAYLESLSRVRAIAFDKTGTLTEGKPKVIQVRSVRCSNPDIGICEPCNDLLALASAVERRSEHPLARAVVAAAEENRLAVRYPAAVGVTAVIGKGVTGNVAGRGIIIGSHSYFDATVPHDKAVCDEMAAASANGQTPMLVSANGGYLGYITVADGVRETSRQAVAELNRSGIEATVMLTGDNAATARAIAQMVGVTDVRADLLPENKVDAIKALMNKHGSVAMVGDGVNDAPALATATVGIAMGAGTSQAIETADIALMGNDLSKLAFALQLSRATMGTIRANIVFAIGVKVAFLILVLLGLGTMWLAVLADVGAALVVTLFGMRLLNWRQKS